MNELSDHELAVELLQEFGLKEYEAKCFVALSRLPQGTAKAISEASEVPRTRVYDAVRVLESKGLVEIQHSSPQQFRAVPIQEAAETLRDEYEDRTATLVDALENVEPVTDDREEEITHEVWSLSGADAIENRFSELVDSADAEIVLIVGRADALTDHLLDQLVAAEEAGLDVVVGTQTEELAERLRDTLPSARVFVTGLDWLSSSSVDPDDDTTIGRLLLVDGSTILVSTQGEHGGVTTEQAVFGRGFTNGIVTIARRLMATGLSAIEDPDRSDPEGQSAEHS